MAKKKGKKIPVWVWLAVAGAVVLLYVLTKSQGGSTSGTTTGGQASGLGLIFPGQSTWTTKKQKKKAKKTMKASPL